ncbi:MAG: hypothetical protein ACE5HB_05125, partial [Terriglobia bacterium]
DDAEPLTCVLLCPPWPIPTARAYRWAARRLTLSQRAAKMIPSQVPSDTLWGARNDFEPDIFQRFPELARMKADLLGAGARRAGLSGSGSTVFGLFRRRAAAERAAARWAGRAAVFVCRTLSRREYGRGLRLPEW